MIAPAPTRLPNPRPPFHWPGPSFWVGLGVLAAVAGGLLFVPLFNVLSYEFCAVLSFVVSLTAGPIAIGVVRRRPAVLPEDRNTWWIVAGLFTRALLHNLATLVLPLLLIGLNAFRVQNCNFGVGLLFFLLLPVATAIVWTAWGCALGFGVRLRFWGGFLYALGWLGVAAGGALEFFFGPQMDSYNQITGWIPGPALAEAINPDAPLFWSRGFGLVCSLAVLAALAALLDTHLNKLRPGVLWRNRRQTILTLVLTALGGGLFLASDALGFGRSWAAVEAALPSTVQTPHFVIHCAAGLSEPEARLLGRDHEFRFAQIERLLGPLEGPPLHSYVFPSAAQKRRLTGAGHTQYTKPWQRRLFLNAAGFPHPVLKHELAHVLAASFGAWPFRTSGALLQNSGLTEGLAVALDWPGQPFDPHTWSAAQRKTGQAPDIRALFEPLGFWVHSPGRAYTLAGSFVRFLLERYDSLALRQAYQQGSLAGAFPKPPAELFAEWEAFLDARTVDPVVVEAARLRFSQRSIFVRPCAHEVEALRTAALTQLTRGQLDEAEASLRALLGHLPGDPDTQEQLAELLARRGLVREAIALLELLEQAPALEPARRARVGGRLGNLQVAIGEPAAATARFRALLAAHLDDATDREALIKLQAQEKPAAGPAVIQFLSAGKADALALLSLREAAEAAPGWGASWYLLGRQLHNQGAFAQAAGYLERALEAGLGHPALTGEALRLLAIARFRAGAIERAVPILAAILSLPLSPGDRAWAREWLARVAFELTAPGPLTYMPYPGRKP